VIKSRRVRWAGHTVGVGEIGNAKEVGKRSEGEFDDCVHCNDTTR